MSVKVNFMNKILLGLVNSSESNDKKEMLISFLLNDCSDDEIVDLSTFVGLETQNNDVDQLLTNIKAHFMSLEKTLTTGVVSFSVDELNSIIDDEDGEED
jgi:hypothetical protein